MASYIGKNIIVKNNHHTCIWFEQLENRMNTVKTILVYIFVQSELALFVFVARSPE